MRENDCGHCCFARILLSEATSPSFSLPLGTAVAGDVSHRRRAPSLSFSLHPSVLTPPIHPRPCFIMPLQQVAAAADPSTHSDTDDKCYQSSSGIPPDKEGGRKLNRSHMLGDDIFTLDDDEWQAHKKIAHIVLASKEFRSFMASVSKKLVGDGLLSLMLQAAKHGNILDLEDVFMKFAFNSAYTTVLGRNPNLLSLSSATNEIAKAIDNGTEGVFHRHIMPRKLWKLLGWLGVGSEGRLARAQQIINHHLLEHISLKREEMRKGVQGSDLIAMYMSSQAQNGESKAYSDLFLRDIALGFLFAGRDSTGTSLTWFLWLVSTTPRMEEKILDELMRLKKKKEAEGVVRDQKQPWVFDSEDLKDLVYFHAAMCESLRLNPPLPLTRRGVIKEDVLPDGTAVKPGMKIIISMYALGRLEWLWGKDYLEFKPERWIDQDGKISQEAMSKFFPFTIGPRACPGRNMAFTQMKLAAAAVLFNFRIEVLEGQIVFPMSSIVLHMKNGLKVKIRERVW